MGDRYRLQHRIGHGGMAEVYRAEAVGGEGFTKPVAVKRILPSLASDERVIRMFLAEAQLARHLHHQNIVEVLDLGRGPEGLFIVMEWVDGWDLRQISKALVERRQQMPTSLAFWIATQVLAGLSHAYRRTSAGKALLAAHRDVSLSNVLVSREGEVKLADFGIAKRELDSSLTEPGTFKGKMAYAAPEVLKGKPATPASDEFSLGISLYELLTGDNPYGDPEAPGAYIEALLSRVPAPVPGLSAPAWSILRRMLSVQPEARFGTPDAVARAMGPLLVERGAPVGGRELADLLGELALSASDEPTSDNAPVEISLTDASWIEPDVVLPDEWEARGPQLDASGRLIGQPLKPPPQAPPPEAAPSPVALSGAVEYTPASHAGPHSAGWMEPVPTGLPPPSLLSFDSPEPKGGSSRAGWLVAVIILLGLGGGAAWWGPRLYRRALPDVPLPRPASSAHQLHVLSEPSGALVRINGKAVGQTPLFLDNVYPPGNVSIEITHRSYRPWSGTFRGNEEAHVNASLEHP